MSNNVEKGMIRQGRVGAQSDVTEYATNSLQLHEIIIEVIFESVMASVMLVMPQINGIIIGFRDHAVHVNDDDIVLL